MLDFPAVTNIDALKINTHQHKSVLSWPSSQTAPGPLAVNSPARRPIVLPGSPLAPGQRADEPGSVDYRKKLLMQHGPILDMQQSNSASYGMPEESLFTALKDIFHGITMHSSRTGIVSPHKLLQVLRTENETFRSAMHQDAHEFLNLLLNQVVDCVAAQEKRVKGEPSDTTSSTTSTSQSWVHNLFEGLLVSETRCLTCETISSREETFMDLSLDLTVHSSVSACLVNFSQEEMLCGRNKFHCDKCSGLQEAEKRMKIKCLPRILALHLKRFEYTEDYGNMRKLFHRVSYPFYLRLFNTTDDADEAERIYELYAVIVHIGGGAYHGHYVSIIKTRTLGWLLFDDELVEPVHRGYVQDFFGGEPKLGTTDPKQLACAYVLFYQETTLEAMQREEDAERRTTAARAAEAVPSSPIPNGTSTWTTNLRGTASGAQVVGDATDIREDNATKPEPNALPSLPTSPMTSTKSKWTLRKEDKDRKSTDKEFDKLVKKSKRKSNDEPGLVTAAAVAAAARRERSKSADLQLRTSRDASSRSRSGELSRGSTTLSSQDVAENKDSGQTNANGETGKGSTRFSRHGSMHLRQIPRLWGTSSAKDRDKEKDVNSRPTTGNTTTVTAREDEGTSKRGLFGLSRKSRR